MCSWFFVFFLNIFCIFFSFPEIAFFKDESIQDAMLNVLFCYARVHAKVIYRQVDFSCWVDSVLFVLFFCFICICFLLIECLYFRLDQNPKQWLAAVFENSDISAMGHPIHFIFGSRVGFSGLLDRMALHPIGPNQDRGHQPSCIILNGHISETFHPIQFVFGTKVKVWEKIMRKE